MKKILFGFLPALLVGSLHAATYYVDQTGGNDANNGSLSAPWKNCPGLVGYSGTASLQPGDIVNFDRSDIWSMGANGSGPGLEMKAGVHYIGHQWDPEGVGPGRAILRAVGTHESGNVRIWQDHLTLPTEIEGFEIDGNGFRANGIDINHAHWTTGLVDGVKRINNCVVHGQTGNGSQGDYKYGIIISDNSPDASGEVKNVEIIDSRVYDAPRSGILLYPGGHGRISDIRVRGCDVSRSIGDPSYTAAQHGIAIKGDVRRATIENNYIHDVVGSAVFISGPEDTSISPQIAPTDITIKNNILQANTWDGVVRLYKYGNKSVNVFGNLIFDNLETGGLSVGGNYGVTTLRAYNNTFYNTFVDLSGNNGTYNVLDFRNNIVSSPAGRTPLSISAPNNILTNSNPGFKNTQNRPTGFTGTYGTDIRPNTDGFSLNVGAQGIDTGVALAAEYSGSINSVTRPQGGGWDIGAYEFGSGTPPAFVYHPADIPPQDKKISMNEATSFGSCWKNNCNVEATLDNAARAGAIWKNGESYRYDLSNGACPLCWVAP